MASGCAVSGMFLRPVVCPVSVGSGEVALILDPYVNFWCSDRSPSNRHSRFRPRNSSTSSSRNDSSATDTTADLDSLQRQLRLVDRRLATLSGRLEVLKAVQQVLPPGKLLASHWTPFIALIITRFAVNKRHLLRKTDWAIRIQQCVNRGTDSHNERLAIRNGQRTNETISRSFYRMQELSFDIRGQNSTDHMNWKIFISRFN